MISLDIVVPYYGNPDYLMRTVGSVRALEDTDWRLTILEDCFPDGAAVEKTVNAIGDERINYLRNDKNLGVAGNKHRALREAKQDYFVMLDADDIMLPNYGREIARLLERHPGASMVQPGIQVIDEQDQPHLPLADKAKALARPRGGEMELRGEPAATSLLRGNWLYTPALTYRRDISRDLVQRPDSDAVHDLAIVMDILMRGGNLVLGDQVAFKYRRHRSSHSSTVARDGTRFRQERRYFVDMQRELADFGWPKAARASRNRVFSRLNALVQVPWALRARDLDVTRGLLRHALR
ncbi:glycosyltransferase family 2 protein [Actinokineospora sp. G85]|uniref:glycosyltransferase family 2 protein n=1 Tax=Actinokineospora sp. G85 TaxID=3406626 RepID=UPI003C78C993